MRYLKLGSVIFSALAVVATIGWLFVQNFVPLGVYRVVWKANEVSPKVGALVPESRVGDAHRMADGVWSRALNAQPVNFDVKIPRGFASAEVRVKYSGNPKIFELGALASRQTWTNEMQPAENAPIDNLRWTRIAENGLVLYERRPDFNSLGDFLAKMPMRGVAVYRAAGFPEAAPENYTPSLKVTNYTVPFRGATTIKTYLKNEKLNFIFKIQEVNRNTGGESFRAAAVLGGREIARADYTDDSNVSAGGKLSGLRELKLYTNEPMTGVVTINLPAPDDVFFRETSTAQAKFVFVNRFYLADNVGYSTAPATALIVADGNSISAVTAHADAFQTLKIGGKDLIVNDLNTPFVAPRQGSDLVKVESFKGDVRLETAGLFAFSADNYWRPDPPALTAQTDVDREGINYILTSYVPPLHEGVWRVASADFDFSKLAVYNGAVNFTLSLPGKTAAEVINVAEINVTFRRPPLAWVDLENAFSKVWKMIIKH